MSYFGSPAKPKDIPAEIEQAVEDVSTAAGFVSREPLKPTPKRRRGTSKQLHNFTMRLDVDDMAAFIRFCDTERLSYREAFGQMVRRFVTS